jgi:uracil-DNA glycosylase
MFFEQMHKSWQVALAAQRPLLERIEVDLRPIFSQIAPVPELVCRAFEMPIDEVRVLLLGQDPYPTDGDAVGLAFAVAAGRALPRSLRNIMVELASDVPEASHAGDLSRWSKQGVMLLNRHLTTGLGSAGSHIGLGWQEFTDAAVQALAQHHGRDLVAVLWGNQARTAQTLLGEAQIVASAHPSPLSAHRGFFGSKPFSQVNQALEKVGREPIDWSC